MSIKSQCGFAIEVLGDGTSTSLSVLMATAPFGLATPSSAYSFQTTFNLSALTPTGVNNLSVSGPNSHTVTATIGLLGEITFTFDSPLSANSIYTVSGYFEF